MPLYLCLIAMIVFFDQVIKYFVVTNIAPDHTVTVINGVISLTFVKNSGAAWSILAGQQWLFTLITLVAIGLFGYYLLRLKNRWEYALSLAFLLGGTLGNFIDRIHQKYVVDMFSLDFINFPIFNFADVCLTLGVLGVFIALIVDEYLPQKNHQAGESK